MTFLAPRPAAELIGQAAAVGRRIGRGVVRQVTQHPHAIARLDASAATLWPANPEEAEPPHWRLDVREMPAPSPRRGPCNALRVPWFTAESPGQPG